MIQKLYIRYSFSILLGRCTLSYKIWKMYAFFLEKIENNKIRQNNKNALINKAKWQKCFITNTTQKCTKFRGGKKRPQIE